MTFHPIPSLPRVQLLPSQPENIFITWCLFPAGSGCEILNFRGPGLNCWHVGPPHLPAMEEGRFVHSFILQCCVQPASPGCGVAHIGVLPIERCQAGSLEDLDPFSVTLTTSQSGSFLISTGGVLMAFRGHWALTWNDACATPDVQVVFSELQAPKGNLFSANSLSFLLRTFDENLSRMSSLIFWEEWGSCPVRPAYSTVLSRSFSSVKWGEGSPVCGLLRVFVTWDLADAQETNCRG